jgi:DNA-binding IclR family transcriptional regulator
VPTPETQAVRRNTTADRAIDVLLLFDERRPVLPATEIAQELEMSRSTTYRYLQTLRSYGFLEEVPSRGGFRLGPRIFQLARVARNGIEFVDVALPVMQELAHETGENVLLTRRAGHYVVCVERVQSPRPVRLSYERGHTLPIHAGASAKVLLAYADDADIESVLKTTTLTRFTDATVTNAAQLRKQLRQIHANGYAVSVGEVDPGVTGVAAPIFHANGRIAAGLSVAGLSANMPKRQLPAIIAAVRHSAETITAKLADVES